MDHKTRHFQGGALCDAVRDGQTSARCVGRPVCRVAQMPASLGPLVVPFSEVRR